MVTRVNCLVFLLAAASDPPCANSTLPPALRQALKQRQDIRRADVWWAVGSIGAGLRSGRLLGRRMCIAGDDIAQFDYGDDQGITGRMPDGTPVSIPTRELFTRDLTVHYKDGDPFAVAERQSSDRPVYSDVRVFGLLPERRPSYRPLNEILCTYPFDDDSARAYRQRREGRLYVVTLKTQRGTEVRWYIDPDKDYSVVRAERYDDGLRTAYSVSHLERFGDVWFPGSVEFYRGDRPDPIKRIVVRHALLNDPSLPERLTPAALELEPGITFMIAEPGKRRAEAMVWTGQELVDAREWYDLERRGAVTPGPTVLAWRRKAERIMVSQSSADARLARDQDDRPPAAPAPKAPAAHRRPSPASAPSDPWYLYTIRFIEHYKLDAQQRQRALAIYRECRQRADARLAQLRPRLRSIQQRIASATERSDSAALNRFRQELRDATAGIDAIFEKQLKPRLERLPTRAQRRAAGPLPAASSGKP